MANTQTDGQAERQLDGQTDKKANAIKTEIQNSGGSTLESEFTEQARLTGPQEASTKAPRVHISRCSDCHLGTELRSIACTANT